MTALLHLDDEVELLRARRESLRTRLIDVVKAHIDPGVRRIVSEDDHKDAEPWLDDDDAD